MARVLARRRFRFSLTSLFVAVTVLGGCLGWLGWQVRLVNERKALRSWLKGQEVLLLTPQNCRYEFIRPPVSIPVWRQWMGDEALAFISFKQPRPEEEIERVRRAFPEADLELLPVPQHGATNELE